jgi:hypothetical protein
MTVQQWSDWLPAEDAAERLGVSLSTLKRRIQQWVKDGQPIRLPDGRSVEIQAEVVERPQGHEWRVRLPADLAPAITDQVAPDSKEPPAVSSDQGDDRALVREVLARMDDRDAIIREKDDRIAALAAGKAAAEAQAAMLKDELARERNRSWWDRLWGIYPSSRGES